MSANSNVTCTFLALAVLVISERLVASAIGFDGSSYTRNASLDTDLDIFWTIDDETETIRIAVHAKDATGWAGVGTSEMGGMEGADIVFYEAETGEITDAHSIVAGVPATDECTQDWILLSAAVSDGSLVFEAERALDTGDAQDRGFVDDTKDGVAPTRLLAAWGDSDTISYHGAHFGKAEVVMFGGQESSNMDPLVDLKSDPSVSTFDVTAFHIVGFEGVVQSDTSDYVHHLVLRGWYGVPDCGAACMEWQNAVAAAAEAKSTDVPAMPPMCDQMDFADMYAWAPKIDGVALPEEAGFRFGNDTGGFASVEVGTHYNNPSGDEGLVDNSGVRVFYTEELRPHDMGTMLLGYVSDPTGILVQEPIADGKTSFSFGCPGSCTEEHFEIEEVTIFSHFLHMHESGRRLTTRQYRNDSNGNEAFIHSAEVEYYSFSQAGGYVVYPEGATIRKGDRFETECFYDTVGSENVMFGFGSENEMYNDFVAYYPNQKIPMSGACGHVTCGGTLLEHIELSADSDFNRTFGTAAATCATDDEASDALTASSSHTLAGFAYPAGAALWLMAVTPMLVGKLIA
eukprot:g13725.t1